jgi:hypothetical protein
LQGLGQSAGPLSFPEPPVDGSEKERAGMTELSTLRAQYKELSGKNASPSMKADALQARIAELQAAAGKPSVDEAADRAAAEKDAADRAAAEKDAADRAAAEKDAADRAAAEKDAADRAAAENDAADRAAAEKDAADRAAAEKDAADRAAAENDAADRAAAEKDAADRAAAEKGSDPTAAEPEQSVEDACAELGLTVNDGQADVEMLTGLSGPDVCLIKGDPHVCAADEAVRLVRAGYARPR